MHYCTIVLLYTKILNNMFSLILVDNLRQRAESMIVPHTHPYLTGQLFKSGLNFHSPGNFKIAFLNISCIS